MRKILSRQEACSRANKCYEEASFGPEKLQKKFQENSFCKFCVSPHPVKKTLKIAIFGVLAHLQKFYKTNFNSFLGSDSRGRTRFLGNPH